MSIIILFSLLVAFQCKHLLCDYYLQGKYMLGKFNANGWVTPLFCHVLVHGIATFIIGIICVPFLIALYLSMLDMTVHFVVDRWKVIQSRSTDHMQPYFWHLLGIDQMLHHLTHYFIIFVIFTYFSH